MTRHWSAIKSFKYSRKRSAIYNVMVHENSVTQSLESADIDSLYFEQEQSFKINASIGAVLINQSGGENSPELRYWHSSVANSQIFAKPWLIKNKSDMNRFKNALSTRDWVEHATRDRPDTAWSMHLLTNVTFYVYPIPNHVIGGKVVIPQHVRDSRAILCLDKDGNGKTYSGNKCVFRALAMSRQLHHCLETNTNLLCDVYLKHRKIQATNFRGVRLSDLKTIEQLFEINVLVFTLHISNGTTIATCERKSEGNYEENLYLHLQGNHFCFITNIDLYSKSYRCETCDKLFTTLTALRRHSNTCSNETWYKYPAGEFKTTTNIFDRLHCVGINVDASRRHHSLFAVYDCESFMNKDQLPRDTNTISWECEHKLASISIASNIAGFREPVCYVNDDGNEKTVVMKTVKYLELLAETAYTRLRQRYNDIFLQIDKKKDIEIERDLEEMQGKYSEKILAFYERLEEDLDLYLTDLPVLGYNSGRYDLNLIRKYLFDCLHECDDPVGFVVKKGNNYMCIKTTNLKFLDITNYIAPGYSYSDYLKAYEVTDVSKSIWIHSRFDSLEVLKRTDFPAYEEFYNELKQRNVSREEYEACKKVYQKESMVSLRDLLVHYNNLDTLGFVTAVERQQEFFRSKNLDFKSSISLPGTFSEILWSCPLILMYHQTYALPFLYVLIYTGLALEYLMTLKDHDAPIFLFGNKHKDLYEVIRNNIRGGSILHDTIIVSMKHCLRCFFCFFC